MLRMVECVEAMKWTGKERTRAAERTKERVLRRLECGEVRNSGSVEERKMCDVMDV